MLCQAPNAKPVTKRPTDKQPGTPEFALLPCPFCGELPHQASNGRVSCQNRECGIEGQWMPLDKWAYRAGTDEGGRIICGSISDLYHELLYAVACKFPNESRHQTALRYIEERERQSGSSETEAARHGV